jgi:hypothetical protein
MNGATSHDLTTDGLLSLENAGSQRIVHLSFKGQEDNDEGDSLRNVRIQIVDLDNAGTRSSYSIGWEIEGPSRDWSFVTSAEVKERLKSLRCPRPQRFLTGDMFMLGYWALTLVFMLLMVPFFKRPEPPDYVEYPDLPVFEIPDDVKPTSARLSELISKNPPASFSDALVLLAQAEEHRMADIDKLRKKHAEENDVLKAEYKSAKKEYDNAFDAWMDERPFWTEPQVIWASIVAGLFMIIALRQLLSFLFPPYNYLWGGYIRRYERRQSIRSFVFVSVLAALGVSIIAGFIVAYVID